MNSNQTQNIARSILRAHSQIRAINLTPAARAAKDLYIGRQYNKAARLGIEADVRSAVESNLR